VIYQAEHVIQQSKHVICQAEQVIQQSKHVICQAEHVITYRDTLFRSKTHDFARKTRVLASKNII
jgi:hypothetical protein